MHTAVTTLEKAARQLRISGDLEHCEFDRIMMHLHSVSEGLSAVERRIAKRKAAPVNFTELVRSAMAPMLPDCHLGNEAAAPLQPIMVEGPAQDLSELLCSLVEYARDFGRDGPELRLQIKEAAGKAASKCTTVLVVNAFELPDFLRRKLWDAARVRGGEVSITSEPSRCQIEFTLPIDRRASAPA